MFQAERGFAKLRWELVVELWSYHWLAMLINDLTEKVVMKGLVSSLSYE